MSENTDNQFNPLIPQPYENLKTESSREEGNERSPRW